MNKPKMLTRDSDFQVYTWRPISDVEYEQIVEGKDSGAPFTPNWIEPTMDNLLADARLHLNLPNNDNLAVIMYKDGSIGIKEII